MSRFSLIGPDVAADPPPNPLEEAVLWLDAADSTVSGGFVSNLGTGGSALDATFGSGTGVDGADPDFLDWDGTDYIWCPGSSDTQSITSPDGTDISAKSYYDFRWAGTAASWRPSASFGLVCHSTSSSFGIALAVLTTGALRFSWSTSSLAATNYDTTQVLTSWSADQCVAIRCVYDSAAGGADVLKFYWRTTTLATARADARSSTGWTLLESIAGPSGAARETSGSFKVGTMINGTTISHTGKFVYADVRTADGGAVVRDIDASRVRRTAPNLGTWADVERLAVIGDSITIRNDDRAATIGGEQITRADSWASYLSFLSNGKMHLIRNGAVASYTTTNMLGDLPALLARNPTVVGILGGTNDGTLALTQRNIPAMVDLVRSAGAKVFIGTVPPRGQPAMPTPAAPTLEEVVTGGTLANATTYSYRVAATCGSGLIGTLTTLASSAATITTTSATSSIRVRCPYVPGATGWRVYRGINGGEQAEVLVATISPASYNYTAALLYTDTGTSVGTAMPVANTTAYNPWTQSVHDKIAAQNAWLAQYCADENIPLVDFHTATVTNDMWSPGFSFDGLHPHTLGSKAMAVEAWATLDAAWSPTATVPLTDDNASTSNLQRNGLNLLESSERPSGWGRNGAIGTGTNIVYTTAAKAGFAGQAFTAELTASDSLYVDATGSTAPLSGLTPGHTVMVSARVQTEGMEAGGGVGFVALVQTAFTEVGRWQFSAVDMGPGVIVGTFTVPDGVTSLFMRSGVLNGVGKISVGEITVYDLTADPDPGLAPLTWYDEQSNVVTMVRPTSGKKVTIVERPKILFGTDDYLEVPDNPALDFGASDPFTALVAVRQWPTQTTGTLIAKATGPTSVTGYQIDNSAGTSVVAKVGDGTLTPAATAAAASIGLVQIIAVERNPTTDTVRALVNGLEVAVTDTTTATSANSSPLRIGNNYDATLPAHMELLGAAVFDRVLTAKERALIAARYGAVWTSRAIADAEYTFVLDDDGANLAFTAADQQQVYVPSNDEVPFPIGTVLSGKVRGGGGTTGGVTLWATPFNPQIVIHGITSAFALPVGATFRLEKVGTDQWRASGGFQIVQPGTSWDDLDLDRWRGPQFYGSDISALCVTDAGDVMAFCGDATMQRRIGSPPDPDLNPPVGQQYNPTPRRPSTYGFLPGNCLLLHDYSTGTFEARYSERDNNTNIFGGPGAYLAPYFNSGRVGCFRWPSGAYNRPGVDGNGDPYQQRVFAIGYAGNIFQETFPPRDSLSEALVKLSGYPSVGTFTKSNGLQPLLRDDGEWLVFGNAPTLSGGYLYIFGQWTRSGLAGADGQRLMLARRGEFDGPYGIPEFWDGTGWSADIEDAAEVLGEPEIGSQFSVHWISSQSKWMLTSKHRGIFGTGVHAWAADDLQGPWVDIGSVYEIPEEYTGDASYGGMSWIEGTDLKIIYNLNYGDVPSDYRWYGVRLVTVPIPDLTP